MPSMALNAAFPTSPLSRSALMGDTFLSAGSGDESMGDLRSRPLARRRPPSASNSTSPYRSPLASSSRSSSPSSSNWLPKRMPSSASSPVLLQHGHMLSSTVPATPRPGRRRSSNHYSTSPTPNRPLIGSYSESLLSGRMSTNPSIPFPFQAELGVLGAAEGETPRHLKVDFDARFYAMPEDSGSSRLASHWSQPSYSSSPSPRSFSASYLAACTPSTPGPSSFASPSTQNVSSAPYVGTIDLDAHYHSILSSSLAASRHTMPLVPPVFPGYEVPPRGQVQLLVKNTNLQSAVKLFLVPYDLKDMPTSTKTFIRKKICVETLPLRDAGQPGPARRKRHSFDAAGVLGERLKPMESLKYAVHLQFVCVPGNTFRPKKAKKTATAPNWMQPDAGVAQHSHSDFICSERSGVENSASPNPEPAPRYFLYRSIRVVFSPRPPEKEDIVKTYIETPAGLMPEDVYVASQHRAPEGDHTVPQKVQEQSYSTFSGNSEEWEVLRKKVVRSRKEWKMSGSRGRKNRAESQDPDVSSISLASTAEAESADTSAISIPGEPFVMDDEEMRAGPDGDWSMGEHEHHPTSPPADVYAPNPDPNGELWQAPAESEEENQIQDGAQQRWDSLTSAHHGHVVNATPPPEDLHVRSTEYVGQPSRTLRRQRSRTITPNPDQNARDAAAARRSMLPPSARSLPVSPGMSSRRPASPATAAPSATSTVNGRPASPSPFAPAFSLQRISIRPSSPALAATTPTNVSGVTSPGPNSSLTISATPHSPGERGSSLGLGSTPTSGGGGGGSNSHSASVGRGGLPYPYLRAGWGSSTDRLDLQSQTQTQVQLQVGGSEADTVRASSPAPRGSGSRMALSRNPGSSGTLTSSSASAAASARTLRRRKSRTGRSSSSSSDSGSEDETKQGRSSQRKAESEVEASRATGAEEIDDDQALLEMWHSSLSLTRRGGNGSAGGGGSAAGQEVSGV
ncbi:hypothetical protein BCV69DRAFT_313659 [Microstroma glucosiphilum]|uniref:Atos-like conserved domain-containing protein n=1 Tax=Pseudomicrostroma glucosiphilum TaxID=1684307 RepID=A0A316U2B1_9BASI|nr:hypothetical protein BCV69DRAFT_313659 [Pseudomicrostroma glucosiphilum]PWN19397.1 hypothetical protein BCV69DRAFT_313659 [Pseudomicrostroma glucosiphilum]